MVVVVVVVVGGAQGSCSLPRGRDTLKASGSGLRVWQPESSVCLHESMSCDLRVYKLRAVDKEPWLVSERII